jgi:hypothetical protein
MIRSLLAGVSSQPSLKMTVSDLGIIPIGLADKV